MDKKQNEITGLSTGVTARQVRQNIGAISLSAVHLQDLFS
jgi:hypothetical protein